MEVLTSSLAVLIPLLILVVFVLAVLVKYVRIVPQSEVYVVERLGAYNATLSTGLHFLVPIIDYISNRVSMKEQVADFPPQPVITKDNVTIQIDTVVYYFITDAKLYTYGVDRPIVAIENLTATTLRNIIGDLELDECLTSRDTINAQVRSIVDEATDPWGIKINRVELKNIIPPRDIQDAMEKQMRAERERREQILRAEGEKRAVIMGAEGEREAVILKAEAAKKAAITEAEGQAEAVILMAEAQARSIELISKAAPTQAYLTLKSYEALEKVADGQATKLIIPSDVQKIVNTTATIKETFNALTEHVEPEQKEELEAE
ncbi:MAG: SPFH/Band 7/PHB domain protein [Firmicutes bacterium]|jgi:regulator of protease activity HflC (stomatin/prohibitin superfamily)|nr:SPFH/Band 7/PHB domain protein [Bacillota bacterium]